MARKMKILGVSGSIRKGSVNTSLLREARKFLPNNATLEIYIPDGLPLFNQDIEKPSPPEVKKLKSKIKKADVILFACPEHNSSVTAVLKNAIEWANRPWGENSWDGKKAAIIGAGGASGTRLAQHNLRQIFTEVNVITFNNPQLYVTKAMQRFDEKGNLVDENAKDRLKEFVDALVDFAKSP